MQRPRRQGAPALSADLEKLLAVAAIVSAQGEVRLPTWRGAGPEWVASFPEVALLRDTCRAAKGDRALLANVARMRQGRSGVTLLHRAAFFGDCEAAKAALLHANTLLSFAAERVDVGSVPRNSDAAPLTPLAMALDGARGSSEECAYFLLALGASPDRALEGLVSNRHNVWAPWRPALGVALVSHVLELVSPSFSLWATWDVGLMLRDPGITAAATRRLVEEVPGVLAGDFDSRIKWDLHEFSDRYGDEHCKLLRALAANLPERYFGDVLQAYASIEDTEALAAALDTDLAMQPAHRATALWAAAISGMRDRVERFLGPAVQIVSLPGPPYSNWATPLAAAVANGHIEIVDYLLTHQTPAQGTFAEKLQAAVEVGLSERLQHLLTHHVGALDLEAQFPDEDGDMFDDGEPRYILVLACAQGRQDIVEMLVGAGASVHVGMDSKQNAPLVFFAAGLHNYCRTEGVTDIARVALAKYLIQKGALYSEKQWVAFAVGKPHLDGMDVSWLDECDVIKSAVAELELVWGEPWVA